MAKIMKVHPLPVFSDRLKKQRSDFVICWIIVTVLSLVSAQIITPQNTAVNSGTLVSYLNCSYPGVNQSQFVWQFTNLSGITSVIAFGCSPINTQQYGMDCSTQNTVNLVIRNAQSSQAGVYMCLPGDKTAISAQFIVLGGDVTCSTNPTVEVSVNQPAELTCGTQVYGNMKPVMTWTNSAGTTLPSNPTNTSVNVGATATVLAQIPTVPSYTCSSKFINNPPPSTSGAVAATNLPTYTSSCNTQSLQVLYPPPSATITLNGNPNNVSCTDTLTCSAVSFPNSTFSWTLPDGSTTTGPTVAVSQSGQTGTNLVYKCTASNNQLGSAQAFVTLNITYCPTTTVPATTTTTATTTSQISGTTTPSSYSSDNVGAIVGGVIGGFVGVTLIIFLICYCVNSCPLYKYCRAEQLKEVPSSSFSSVTHQVPHDVIDPPPVYETVAEGEGRREVENNYERMRRDIIYYQDQEELHQYDRLNTQNGSIFR